FREARSDLLQLRIPRQLLPPAPASLLAARGPAPRGGDPRPPGRGARRHLRGRPGAAPRGGRRGPAFLRGNLHGEGPPRPASLVAGAGAALPHAAAPRPCARGRRAPRPRPPLRDDEPRRPPP